VGAPAAKTAVESSTRVVGWWLAGCAGNTVPKTKKYVPPRKGNLSKIINIWRAQRYRSALVFNADTDRAFWVIADPDLGFDDKTV
jgi:hypothetical protein